MSCGLLLFRHLCKARTLLGGLVLHIHTLHKEAKQDMQPLYYNGRVTAGSLAHGIMILLVDFACRFSHQHSKFFQRLQCILTDKVQGEDGGRAIDVASELLGAFSEVRQQISMLEGLSKAIDDPNAMTLLSHARFQEAFGKVKIILHKACSVNDSTLCVNKHGSGVTDLTGQSNEK